MPTPGVYTRYSKSSWPSSCGCWASSKFMASLIFFLGLPDSEAFDIVLHPSVVENNEVDEVAAF